MPVIKGNSHEFRRVKSRRKGDVRINVRCSYRIDVCVVGYYSLLSECFIAEEIPLYADRMKGVCMRHHTIFTRVRPPPVPLVNTT